MQSLEAGKVLGYVPAGGLESRGHGNAETIVLDVEQHRQFLSGRNGQSGPEAVGRNRTITAQHDADGAVVAFILQHVRAVLNCLRPTRSRGVLRAHTSAHGQCCGAAEIRVVEDHTDIAPVRVSPRTSHRRAKGVS
ncbi:hypothetical protein D9M68_539100 [compost metagenome]